MKAPITLDELKRRMLECGGISSDDAENAAVIQLFAEIDRLRAGKPKPQGKTVRARVAVAVDEFENWSASGWDGARDDEMKDGILDLMEGATVLYWLTADLPIPGETTIEAEVES